MFSILFQHLLVWLAEVSYQMAPSPPHYQALAVQSRLELQPIYFMPEPITVSSGIPSPDPPNDMMKIAAILRALQDDIRFAGRVSVIRQTIVGAIHVFHCLAFPHVNFCRLTTRSGNASIELFPP